jgi:hypothetical protein
MVIDDTNAFHRKACRKGHYVRSFGSPNPTRNRNYCKIIDAGRNTFWRAYNAEFDGLHPKLIVLMIGTNNGGGPEIAAAIKLLIREYETACPGAHILLQAIFPHDHDAN